MFYKRKLYERDNRLRRVACRIKVDWRVIDFIFRDRKYWERVWTSYFQSY